MIQTYESHFRQKTTYFASCSIPPKLWCNLAGGLVVVVPVDLIKKKNIDKIVRIYFLKYKNWNYNSLYPVSFQIVTWGNLKIYLVIRLFGFENRMETGPSANAGIELSHPTR